MSCLSVRKPRMIYFLLKPTPKVPSVYNVCISRTNRDFVSTAKPESPHRPHHQQVWRQTEKSGVSRFKWVAFLVSSQVWRFVKRSKWKKKTQFCFRRKYCNGVLKTHDSQKFAFVHFSLCSCHFEEHHFLDNKQAFCQTPNTRSCDCFLQICHSFEQNNKLWWPVE